MPARMLRAHAATAAYLLGTRAGNIVEALGLVAFAMLIVAVIAHLLWRHMKTVPNNS